MQKALTVAMIGIAAIQFLFIVIGNGLNAEALMDSDSAMAISHGLQMWREGTLFIDGFDNVSTLEIDTMAFLFLPVYLLTGKLGLAFALGHGIMYVIYLALCIDIFRNAGYSWKSGLLASILIFIPYRNGALDYANMIFVEEGQYSFRILCMLLITDLMLLEDAQDFRKKKAVVLTALSAVVYFWTALSSGNYVILVILLPILLWLIIRGTGKNEINLNPVQLATFAVITVCALAGWMVQKAHLGTMSHGAINLLTASEFWPNLGNGITGFFMLFGGLQDNTVYAFLSVAGIMTFLRLAIPLLCLVTCIVLSAKKDHLRSLCGIGLSITAVNLVVMVFTHTRYGALVFEYRYHIMWCVMMLLCTGILNEYIGKTGIVNLIVPGVIVAALCLTVSGGKAILKTDYGIGTSKAVLEAADQNGCSRIYVINDETIPRVVRILDEEKEGIQLLTVGKVRAKTIGLPLSYSDAADATDRNLVVATEAVWSILSPYYTEGYSWIGEVDGFRIYISDSNPWDGVSGLPVVVNESVDYPYSDGYTYNGVGGQEYDSCFEGRTLMIGKDGDGVLRGPETDLIEGTYTITIEYESGIVNEGDTEFAVMDSDGKVYGSINLSRDSDRVSIEGVQLPGEGALVIQIQARNGSVVGLKRIVYTRTE